MSRRGVLSHAENSMPYMVTTIRRDLKNMELFPVEQGVSATHQAPQPLGPALKGGPPTCKTNGGFVQETIALQGTENLFLKCSHADLVTMDPV